MGQVQRPDRQGSVVKLAAGLWLSVVVMTSGANAATFQPQWGREGMVVSSVAPATSAGQQVLEAGGNAFDAAVATAFAAAVAHPFSSGLGGGMFAVVFNAEDGSTAALDAREVAPASASAGYFRENPDSIRSGARSVAVPGYVQGLWALHQKHGTMPWSELIKPAIALARDGVRVGIWHHNIVSYVTERLEDYPETRRIQTVDGMSPPLGWMLVQADLAKTLEVIQQKGGQALALGPIATKIAEATGNVVTELDLARYKVKWREPVRGSYRGHEIVSMPPPSSGGVLLVQMLNILERYDLASLGHGSSDYVHLLASTMKLAFEDRAAHLGDMDFYPVPLEKLTSRAYADEQAARFNPAGQPKPRLDVAQTADDAGTTHITVMDKYGNAVALTQTINTLFGSKITVPGTGIVLNNEMDDFSVGKEASNLWGASGDAANAVAPGKRPLSSMTPTIVVNDGRAVMAIGSPMGTMIISSVLQTLVNVIDFGFDAQRAVNSPRFHHQWKPDRLSLEPEFSRDVRQRLESLGYTLAERSIIGATQLAVFDSEACMFWGGSDGRRDSSAAAVKAAVVARPSEATECAVTQRNTATAIPR